MRGRGSAQLVVAAAALVAGAVLSGPASAGQQGEQESAVIASLNGSGPNEREMTLPVTRSRGATPEVVLSQRVNAGGGLRRGDVLRAAAEVQLTTTCVRPEPRCIGRPYAHTPVMDARIVIASSPSATGGSNADPISGTVTRRCTQQRPNRNHHCVLPIGNAAKRVKNVGNLPCQPDACYVNMIASASHPRAQSGEVVVVGADTPDGEVRMDKARIDALVDRNAKTRSIRGSKKVRNRVPIAPDGKAGRRVTMSLKIEGAEKGDVYEIDASQVMSISGLPYNTFMGSRLIVASSAGTIKTDGYAARATSLGGEISELNGFNCTKGSSEYSNPCTTRKVAVAHIRRKVPTRNGKPKPIFVNLVMAGLPKLANAGENDHMTVGAGRITAERYRAEPERQAQSGQPSTKRSKARSASGSE